MFDCFEADETRQTQAEVKNTKQQLLRKRHKHGENNLEWVKSLEGVWGCSSLHVQGRLLYQQAEVC